MFTLRSKQRLCNACTHRLGVHWLSRSQSRRGGTTILKPRVMLSYSFESQELGIV